MEILNNYPGSSIEIKKIVNDNNKAYLKLKKENGKSSHYYNFIVENQSNKEGNVYIENINESLYYSKNTFAPFGCINNEWHKLDKESYSIEEKTLKFTIKPNSTIELSLSPRYTKENLCNFCKENKIQYEDNELVKIDLGNKSKPTIFIIGRQHPGETLSSFFIEGIIQEILLSQELLNNYHYILFPIVNVKGVEEGNHRYYNGIDYNRMWNSNDSPAEIEYLKKQLNETNNLTCFIDVHNDEITPNDYIRMDNPISDKIANIQVLENMGKFKRFMRALIKQKKIIDFKQKTAREFVQNEYHCTSILIELSMNDNLNEIYQKGNEFMTDIIQKIERK